MPNAHVSPMPNTHVSPMPKTHVTTCEVITCMYLNMCKNIYMMRSVLRTNLKLSHNIVAFLYMYLIIMKKQEALRKSFQELKERIDLYLDESF